MRQTSAAHESATFESNQSAFPLVLLVQSDLGDFLLSRFNRATLSKTGLIVLRKRTDATCPEQLTVISLPMRPFLDLGVRHLVKYVYRSKSFSQSIAFGLAFHSLIYFTRKDQMAYTLDEPSETSSYKIVILIDIPFWSNASCFLLIEILRLRFLHQPLHLLPEMDLLKFLH